LYSNVHQSQTNIMLIFHIPKQININYNTNKIYI